GRRQARSQLCCRGQGRFARLKACMTAKRSPALDRIDIKILAALQRDGRQSIQKLSATAGLSARACLERVRRLEASGTIIGYQALIYVAKLSQPRTVL